MDCLSRVVICSWFVFQWKDGVRDSRRSEAKSTNCEDIYEVQSRTVFFYDHFSATVGQVLFSLSFVCLFVSSITGKVVDKFSRNVGIWSIMDQRRLE